MQLTDAYCKPKPMQQPHPPICIGGQGEQRTLRSVARFAQHWNFPGGSGRAVRDKRDVLRRALRRRRARPVGDHGVDAPDRGALRDGVDAVVEEAKRYAEAGLDLGIVYLPTPYTTALLDELADALVAARELS